jgi:hypothetical protein
LLKSMTKPTACVALVVALVAAAGCSSSARRSTGPPPTTAAPTPSTTPGSTLDPNGVLNPIPYNVHEPISLPGGWQVEVMGVQRGYTGRSLPVVTPGDEYVAVDVRMTNNGTAPVTVAPAALFTLLDQHGDAHAVVSERAPADSLAGEFAPGATKTGRLVFAAPKHLQLRMLVAGQKIGSQQSIWQIDPPKAPNQD